MFMHDAPLCSARSEESPGFAATAILTPALGIGASTAVFTQLAKPYQSINMIKFTSGRIEELNLLSVFDADQ